MIPEMVLLSISDTVPESAPPSVPYVRSLETVPPFILPSAQDQTTFDVPVYNNRKTQKLELQVVTVLKQPELRPLELLLIILVQKLELEVVTVLQ
jgi:hypothetical protein